MIRVNRMRSLRDSPLEGSGFEISVPRYARWSRASPECAPPQSRRVASAFISTHCRRELLDALLVVEDGKRHRHRSRSVDLGGGSGVFGGGSPGFPSCWPSLP